LPVLFGIALFAIPNISLAEITRSQVHEAPTGTAQIIPNNTETQVTFGNEIYDTNNDFTSNTFIVPRTGYYQITGQISIRDTIAYTGQYSLRIKNNTTSILRTDMDVTGGANELRTINGMTIRYLVAGSTITMYVNHIFGTATPTIVVGSGNSTFLNILEISEPTDTTALEILSMSSFGFVVLACFFISLLITLSIWKLRR